MILEPIPLERQQSIGKGGARGFVRKDGSVFGWCILDSDHNGYHMKHGTSDKDFATRWRFWGSGGPDVDGRDPEHQKAVQDWIDEHAEERIGA